MGNEKRDRKDERGIWMRISPPYLLYLLRLFTAGLSPFLPPSICQTDSCWPTPSVVVRSVPSLPDSTQALRSPVSLQICFYITLLSSPRWPPSSVWKDSQFSAIYGQKVKKGLHENISDISVQSELVWFVEFIVGDVFVFDLTQMRRRILEKKKKPSEWVQDIRTMLMIHLNLATVSRMLIMHRVWSRHMLVTFIVGLRHTGFYTILLLLPLYLYSLLLSCKFLSFTFTTFSHYQFHVTWKVKIWDTVLCVWGKRMKRPHCWMQHEFPQQLSVN